MAAQRTAITSWLMAKLPKACCSRNEHAIAFINLFANVRFRNLKRLKEVFLPDPLMGAPE